jgi:hypothetical protein
VAQETKEQDRGVGQTSDRAATRLAWVVCALALSILALSLALILLGWSTPLPRGWTPWRDLAVSLVGIIGAPVLGGLVASRRPRNPYGWLWLGFGLGLALQLFGESYTAYALVVEPGPLPALRTISRLLSSGGPLALSFAPFLLLLFPTGRLPSSRWRPVAWVAAVSGAVLVSLNLLFGSPDEVGGIISAITFVVVIVLFSAIILSAISLVTRYRRASGVERQQLKWFAMAAVLATFYIVALLLGFERLLGGALLNLIDASTNMLLYAAVGVAILRHRLYDIDVIINRTLVYGPLTVTLVLVYIVGVVGLQAIVRALSGQESTLAVVASTLMIAALFNPLRHRVQGLVDRRFYRRKYDARKTLERFSARLRNETDLEALNNELESVVREAMQPAHAALWLRPAPNRRAKEEARSRTIHPPY